jgi:4-carboxymuconolactone decarboxylase
MLGTALTVGVSSVEVKEVVYQSVPSVGMAKAFDFRHATNDVLAVYRDQLPVQGQATTTRADRFADDRNRGSDTSRDDAPGTDPQTL